jgi:hypothetical protein
MAVVRIRIFCHVFRNARGIPVVARTEARKEKLDARHGGLGNKAELLGLCTYCTIGQTKKGKSTLRWTGGQKTSEHGTFVFQSSSHSFLFL